ncbi:HAMP domain protein [Burkholderia thailandensis MSMB121]|uniref:ATP-binding protein n=1 Tax=Burkholderia humptydooensis TaxID=430531 RepID=UPI0003280E59|nr:ATP-binding protein [Burkholderia humptydooensis]AGK46306.1 HAMP domain protein [Burkholderia thailandensis MSMB121]ATF37035.1 two-component sensor histidine kinase [Burkholderia thailandensis]KST74401.1 histidine kinase [Burkholderia humptydooensis]
MKVPRPRTLLGRNLLLLVCIVAASQVATAVLYFLLIQLPRIDEIASVVASQTKAVERLLAARPEPERRREVVAMNGGLQGPPERHLTAVPRNYQIRRFVTQLAARLTPGTLVLWEGGLQHRFWVRLAIDRDSYWVALPVTAHIGNAQPWSVACLLLVFATFPVFGAWMIQRDTTVPLRRLSRAAATIERGEWPDAVPVTGPAELAMVADAFNRMVASLAVMETTRAEMLAGISHDIRTPLTKLRMAIAAPEAFDAPRESAERFVAEIDAIVDQFIDFARSGDGEAVLPGDLNALIEQLVADYTGLGYRFDMRLAPLPAMRFRPVGMQRLLMNLMHNAAIHGRVGLSVHTSVEGGRVVIRVEDAGPGVPEDALPLLTQPFRRVERPDHPSGGTGLGLAIAERIARQHGGRLDLSLRNSGGLKATVRLPIA